MKFGFSTLGCPNWSLEKVAQAADDFGYEGVELRVLDGEVITPAIIRANLGRIGSLFGPGRPVIVGLGTSVRFSMVDNVVREQNERELREFVDLARDMHVPMLRVFGGRLTDGDSVDAAIPRVAESFNNCAAYAEAAGVALGLETHDEFSKSSVVADVLRRVPSQGVGAIWDTHHPYSMGESVAVVWSNLAGRLLHVHLKDARRRGSDAWDLVLLGTGEVPCREILRALAMRGYDGWVVAEWEKKWHPEIEEPEIALPQHLATMKEWVTELL